MSCQTNKGSGPPKSLGLGRSPACLGEGSQAAIFYPSPSTALFPAARTSRSSAGTGWRAHAAQHARSPRSTSSLPSPGPARPADNTHPRTAGAQRPGCAWRPPAPSPARARSSDGPGRGQRRGRKAAAAGFRSSRRPPTLLPFAASKQLAGAHSAAPPSPRRAPRRPAAARPARRRRRPLPGR